MLKNEIFSQQEAFTTQIKHLQRENMHLSKEVTEQKV